MKIRARRFVILVSVAMFVLMGVAIAKAKKHNHHNAHQMVGDKLKKDGTHQIHKNGKHTVSAEVKNGKIAGVHVKHDTKGDVAVKKYKSKKKYASIDNPSQEIPADTADMGTTWIAYAYIDDDGNEEYYWFPYEVILDGDTGAIEYVPLS
jgi:hypothetical protein